MKLHRFAWNFNRILLIDKLNNSDQPIYNRKFDFNKTRWR